MPGCSRGKLLRRSLIGLAIAVSVAAASAEDKSASASKKEKTLENPFTSPEDVAAGAHIMRTRCATCHGREGHGGRGPDLRNTNLRWGNDDASLFLNILKGIPGTGMPPGGVWPKGTWRVIGYIRTLQNRPLPPLPEGDPAKGSEVVENRNCTVCHWIGGSGGRVGPELTRVGLRCTEEYLKTSILDPNETVDLQYRSVSVWQRDGLVIQGRKLNNRPRP